MLAVFAVLILLITAVVLAALQWQKEQVKFAKIIAGGAAFLAWGLLFISRSHLPVEFLLQKWTPETFFPNPPFFYIDQTTWVFAISIVGLGIAAVFSSREQMRIFIPWTLGLTGVGVLAVYSANPLTLLYLWTLIDVLTLLFLLSTASGEYLREQIIGPFAIRFLGSIFLAGASIIEDGLGLPLTFTAISASASTYILVAAVLRLGIWMPPRCSQQAQSTDFIIRAIPAATSLILIVRTAKVGLQPPPQPIFLYFMVAVALLGGLLWILSPNERPNLRAWIFGMASLSIVAALLGHPHASQAWSVALLLLGSLLFLAPNWSTPISVLGGLSFLGLTALPFTPTWAGSKIYFTGGWGILLGLAHGFLAGGYLKIVLARHKNRTQLEFWRDISVLLGLMAGPVTTVMVSLFLGGVSNNWALANGEWWGGTLALGVVAALIAWSYFSISIPEPISVAFSMLEKLPRVFRQIFEILYKSLGRLLSLFTEIFEGEGGVIWALLGAFLLITILASWGGG
ncbi:MAG: hypothetical protein U9O54_03245 [Chloroflexota bacterium]|nr:hypothetical protein [Chloroflexota bacterium]